jgi:hypothetical protein
VFVNKTGVNWFDVPAPFIASLSDLTLSLSGSLLIKLHCHRAFSSVVFCVVRVRKRSVNHNGKCRSRKKRFMRNGLRDRVFCGFQLHFARCSDMADTHDVFLFFTLKLAVFNLVNC